jgi:hypothetical protein
MTLIADGDVGPDFSRVLVLGPAPPDQVFSVADTFFGDLSGYSIVVETGTAQAMEDMLRAHAWRLDEEEPALVLPALPPSSPSRLRISSSAGSSTRPGWPTSAR